MSISYWFYSATGWGKDPFCHPKTDYQGVIIFCRPFEPPPLPMIHEWQAVFPRWFKTCREGCLWYCPVFHLIIPQGEDNSQQPYKQREERYFYPASHLHQCIQLWLKRCSAIERVRARVVLSRSCRGCTQKARPGEQLQLHQQSHQQRRFRKEVATQVLSQAWCQILWAPSTAFLYGHSMCMVSLTLLFCSK